MSLPFDPKKFKPDEVDGTDVPIKHITKEGRAEQIIGGVRGPAGKNETDVTDTRNEDGDGAKKA